MTSISWRRVKGVLRHQWYDMFRSPVRTIELAYWPVLWLVLWGFITNFFLDAGAEVPGGVRILLGGLILWELNYRASLEISWAFLIDVWDRNILNVHASPLTPVEHFLGSLLFALARAVAAVGVLVVMAWAFFDYNLFDAGRVIPVAVVALLGMGFAMGLAIRAMILRWGSNAEIMAWSLPFLIQPIAAVFYPVDVLPGWLQAVAAGIPASHIFEALRAFVAHGDVLVGRLGIALGLDVVYLGVAAVYSARVYRTVRVKGLLGRPGY